MIRKEMLSILNDLPYVLIWPEDNWDDVAVTEREIWINSTGYGYILCSESTACWKGEGLDTIAWLTLKEKIEEKTLTYNDIKGTVLETLLKELLYDEDLFNDSSALIDALEGLLKLKNGACGFLYVLQTDTVPVYFDSEVEFKAEYEKDWADEYWKDMSDDLLETWIKRLVNVNEPELSGWISKNKIDTLKE